MKQKISISIFNFFYLLLGIILIIYLPPIAIWGNATSGFLYFGSTVVNTSIINFVFFVISFITFSRIEMYPHKRSSVYILPITISVFLVLMAFISLFRIDYSLKIIVLASIIIPIFLSLYHFVMQKRKKFNFLVAPFGDTSNLISGPFFSFSKLFIPKLQNTNIDGIVVDFSSKNLTPQWEMFISNCAIKGMQVLNANQLSESITGRINVLHLRENNFGNFSPSPLLIMSKTIIDSFIVLILLPIVIIISLITIFFICLESEGGVFYKQTRVGFRGKKFTIFKFRSMNVEKVSNSRRLNNIEIHRITNVGRIIRRYRIDEIPQFWNVLKGELSLIGPRPEAVTWHKKYCKEIPFYLYRNIVKPGITGWAQVMQGHVHGIEDTKLKLEYDFYYIKNFSLWLDLLIVYRTFRAVFLGDKLR